MLIERMRHAGLILLVLCSILVLVLLISTTGKAASLKTAETREGDEGLSDLLPEPYESPYESPYELIRRYRELREQIEVDEEPEQTFVSSLLDDKNNFLSWFVIVLLPVIAVTIIGVYLIDRITDKNEGDELVEPEVVGKSDSTCNKVFALGNRVAVDIFTITLNNIDVVFGNNGEHPDENHVFILVDITIENTTDEPQATPTQKNFDVVDEKGYLQDTVRYSKLRGRFEGDVGPRRKISGEMAWEVPATATGLELIYQPTTRRGQVVWELGDVTTYTSEETRH